MAGVEIVDKCMCDALFELWEAGCVSATVVWIALFPERLAFLQYAIVDEEFGGFRTDE